MSASSSVSWLKSLAAAADRHNSTCTAEMCVWRRPRLAEEVPLLKSRCPNNLPDDVHFRHRESDVLHACPSRWQVLVSVLRHSAYCLSVRIERCLRISGDAGARPTGPTDRMPAETCGAELVECQGERRSVFCAGRRLEKPGLPEWRGRNPTSLTALRAIPQQPHRARRDGRP